ncbi:yjeF N-terminal region [Streptomyces sp. Termitarium-T10T-6]|nr:yjeF N-terminal region [Streptomyces sp. Termitarium-T10T-6]
MRRAYSVETVRAAEAALMQRLPEGALMQRAAAGLAAACGDLLRRNGRVYGSRVLLLVGSGDNGGDALYAGARLARRGAGVRALLLAPDRAHPGGLAAFRAAGGQVVDGPDGLGVLDLVVDGITGIGGRGGLREDATELVHTVTRDRTPVIAVDLPSGVEADTGEVHGEAVRADATVTFGTYKPGLLIDPAAEHAGALRLVDIGLEPELPEPPDLEALQYADVAALLPVPGAESDKYRRGVVGVVAGSERYPGAAVLAVAGALRGGAGAVRYVGPGADAVIARFPEALVHAGPPSKAGRVQAWVVGPGLGDGGQRRPPSPMCSPPMCRCSSTRTGCGCWTPRPYGPGPPRPSSPRTRGRPPRCSARPVRRSSPVGSPRCANWPPATAPPCSSRAPPP